MNISSVQTSSLSSSLGPKKIIGVEGGAFLEYTLGKLKDLYQHDPVRIVFPRLLAGPLLRCRTRASASLLPSFHSKPA